LDGSGYFGAKLNEEDNGKEVVQIACG